MHELDYVKTNEFPHALTWVCTCGKERRVAATKENDSLLEERTLSSHDGHVVVVELARDARNMKVLDVDRM